MSQATAIARYSLADKQPKLALLIDEQLYDLAALRGAGIKIGDGWSEDGASALLAGWKRHAPELKSGMAEAEKFVRAGKLKALNRATIKVLAPFRPERIFCAASNFIEHANEMGTVLAAKAESKPYMFLKLRNTVIGPGDEILMPPETSQLDWEIELAAVIGAPGRRISAERALEHVAAYSIVNDISARDLNVRSDYPFKFDWFQGKCHDTFAPFGPCLVPAWSIADPQAVEMRLTVNDK